MNILGLEVKRIKTNENLKCILEKLNSFNEEVYKSLNGGCNFLINDNFLVGYKKLINENIIMVYMARDDEKNNDGIYARKKLRLFKSFLEKHKDKKIISCVNVKRKEAKKLNEILFDYKTKPIKFIDNKYIVYKNFKNRRKNDL